ncbi:MAG: Rrf2 family transcriptional regulator [Gammaproteobacteria bacterium]|nr:Rrf2 family transcriptional regulator [Gammaproteobacteria bacterium]
MRLSTKSRVAISAMMYLALRGKQGPSNAQEICRDQDISVSYLEQLFAHLRRGGLVEGVRGPGGGYRLARAPEAISVAQIVTAVDEAAYREAQPVETPPGAVRNGRVRDLWQRFSDQVHTYLDGISLADCVRPPEPAAPPQPPTAYPGINPQ